MPDVPRVSVLVAARNEADTIGPCLQTLAALDYPTDHYEVLIGDDDSTDQTAALVRAFIANKPQFRLFAITPASDVTETKGNAPGQSTPITPRLNGKANVLAQLARQARGEFLFTTDADVRVPRTWLRAMLSRFKPETGVVTGTTVVAGTSLWDRLQAIDWLLAFGLIDLGTSLHLPITGSGNNMAVRRVAYDAVGGFESLPFSVVEDYTLFQAVVGLGYGYVHALDAGALAETLPTPTLMTYLHQRKRWMRGAFSLPLLLRSGLLFQYLLVPMLLVVALFSPSTALAIYVGKWLMQTVLLTRTLYRTRQLHRWFDGLLFEPCQVVMGLLSVGYYLLPGAVRWKGRSYR